MKKVIRKMLRERDFVGILYGINLTISGACGFVIPFLRDLNFFDVFIIYINSLVTLIFGLILLKESCKLKNEK